MDSLGEEKAARMIEDAAQKAIKQDLKSLNAGHMGMGTSDVGDLIARYITES